MVWDYHTHQKIGRNKVLFWDGEMDRELSMVSTFITFFVQQLSQFLDKPIIAHYNATIRILKYIKGAPSIGLFFSSSSFAHLKTFYDSDWGTYSDLRQSVIGFSVYLGNSLIS